MYLSQGQPKIQFTILTHDSRNEHILSLLDFSFLALKGEANVLRKFPAPSYSLSQNGWDTLGSPCPLNVGVQDLVTELR